MSSRIILDADPLNFLDLRQIPVNQFYLRGGNINMHCHRSWQRIAPDLPCHASDTGNHRKKLATQRRRPIAIRNRTIERFPWNRVEMPVVMKSLTNRHVGIDGLTFDQPRTITEFAK